MSINLHTSFLKTIILKALNGTSVVSVSYRYRTIYECTSAHEG